LRLKKMEKKIRIWKKQKNVPKQISKQKLNLKQAKRIEKNVTKNRE